MLDRFGRPLRSLRISVTDECNLNCFYCHMEGLHSTLRRQMSAEEIGKVVGLAAEFGVRKIKLTGGEPLTRRDLVEVIASIANESIEEISMSTNGTLLTGRATELAEAGLDRVNISLDTLNQDTYAHITGERLLTQALAGVDAALEAGLVPVKLNMVVLTCVNEREIEGMISYTRERGAILQLIELVRMPENERVFVRHHRNLRGIEERLNKRAKDVRVRHMHHRKKYILGEGEVEVVRFIHNSEFCAHCTRLRLTPDGFLKPCLMRNDNLVDIISPIRSGKMEDARTAFKRAIELREPHFKAERSVANDRKFNISFLRASEEKIVYPR